MTCAALRAVSRLVGWAAKIGPSVARVAEMTLAQSPRPALGYRAVLGLIRFGERHAASRFDAACEYALAVSGSTVPRRKYIAIPRWERRRRPLRTTESDLPRRFAPIE